MSGRPQENVKWVDGLRGIASLLVVFTHLSRGFDEDLFKPVSCDPLGEGGPVPARILQWPILRILIQGRIGVSIFSLVTGYVCALKPIKQFRSGTADAAFSGIAKSAFRRLPRLILPTTIATLISWFICQFGAFEVANHAEGWWIPYSSPKITPNLGAAIQDLLLNMITTWTKLWNIYDINQWTLQPLLKGAFWVYIMLMGTAYVKPRYRMMISLALVVYFYIALDSAFGMQLFFGTFLSDLAQEPTHTAWLAARKWPGRVLSPILIAIGLVLASYPEKNPEWMPWSLTMEKFGHYIFPEEAEFPRYYSALGLVFMTFGIHFSSSVKDILSNRFLLWFGKNSFAVYLLHGTLLRTILVWMIFGFKIPADVKKEDGTMGPGPPMQQGSRAAWYFWVPIWLALLYFCANLWTKHVDPFCARLTFRIEKYVFEEHYAAPPQAGVTLRLNGREKLNASPLPR